MPTQRAARSAEELALLRAVVSDLTDGLALAVYCDWLDEHDDARGPFLREFLREFLRAFDAREPLPPDPPGLPAVWADLLALPIRRRLREGYGPADSPNWEWVKRDLPTGFAPIEPYFGVILRSPQPAVRLSLGDPLPESAFPVGATRAGGAADLPPGVAWPTYDDPRGGTWPLNLLLQIELADLRGTVADGLLPSAGLLSVFHGPDHEKEERKFVYTPPGTPLTRHPVPVPYHWHPSVAGSDDFPKTYHPVTITDALRFPGWFQDIPESLQPFGPSREVNLCDLLTTNWYQEPQPQEHFLGTRWGPDVCYAWEEYVGEGPETYIELLELSSYDRLWWHFGDGDRLHVFVPAANARNGVFDGMIVTEI